MSEDIIKDFVKGFVKFKKNEQLERAKETKGNLEKLNEPTLKWLVETCLEILKLKESSDNEVSAK